MIINFGHMHKFTNVYKSDFSVDNQCLASFKLQYMVTSFVELRT